MDELKETLLKRGATLVGYADLTLLLPEARENMRFGISIAVALNPGVIARIQSGPTKEYYAEYRRVNDLLDTLGLAAAQFLENLGQRAMPLTRNSVAIDPVTFSTRLPHKTVATRAGMGWIGKCALLITEQFGSAIRITTVLTQTELPVDKPIDTSRCGDCISCVEICPGRAPLGNNWQLGMHRNTFFNASACYEAIRDVTRNVDIHGTICGMCIAACPWTRKYITGS